jgi:hypothetical protein
VAKPCVANQESIRDRGADIDTLEVKTSQSRDVIGERPGDFGTTTVWATLVHMAPEISREIYRIAEMAANLKTMAAATWKTVHTTAHKAVQDCLMNGIAPMPSRVIIR